MFFFSPPPPLAHAGQNRSESMSSGSSGTNSYSNSYSNSSSGDGMVLGRGGGDTLDPRHPSQQQQIQDEEYEDFQENNKVIAGRLRVNWETAKKEALGELRNISAV